MKNISNLRYLLAVVIAISLTSCVSTSFIKEIDVAVKEADYLTAFGIYEDNQEHIDANYGDYADRLATVAEGLTTYFESRMNDAIREIDKINQGAVSPVAWVAHRNVLQRADDWLHEFQENILLQKQQVSSSVAEALAETINSYFELRMKHSIREIDRISQGAVSQDAWQDHRDVLSRAYKWLDEYQTGDLTQKDQFDSDVPDALVKSIRNYFEARINVSIREIDEINWSMTTQDDWPAFREILGRANIWIDEYQTGDLIKKSQLGSDMPEAISASVAELKQAFIQHATAAFPVYDHFSAESFFVAVPIEIDNPKIFFSENYIHIQDKIGQATSSQLIDFVNKYRDEMDEGHLSKISRIYIDTAMNEKSVNAKASILDMIDTLDEVDKHIYADLGTDKCKYIYAYTITPGDKNNNLDTDFPLVIAFDDITSFSLCRGQGTMEEFAAEKMLNDAQHVLVAMPDIAHTKFEEQSRGRHASKYYSDSTWRQNPALNVQKAEIREDEFSLRTQGRQLEEAQNRLIVMELKPGSGGAGQYSQVDSKTTSSAIKAACSEFGGSSTECQLLGLAPKLLSKFFSSSDSSASSASPGAFSEEDIAVQKDYIDKIKKGVTGLEKSIFDLEEELSNIAPEIEEKHYQPYEYNQIMWAVNKLYSVNYFVINNKSGAYIMGTYNNEDGRQFTTMTGLKDADPDKDEILTQSTEKAQIGEWYLAIRAVEAREILNHLEENTGAIGEAIPITDLEQAILKSRFSRSDLEAAKTLATRTWLGLSQP